MIKDLVCGLIAMMVAAVYLYASTGLRTSLLGDIVGSAGFPKIIGWGLAFVGLMLIAQSLWSMLQGRTVEGPDGWMPSEAFQRGALRAALRASVIVAIVTGYLLLLEPLGYILSVALMITATSIYLGKPPTWRLALVTILGAISLWLLFAVTLAIPLPEGVFSGWL